ncbi:MAG: ABC transporter substrate-binding protein [Methylococcales bacterium]
MNRLIVRLLSTLILLFNISATKATEAFPIKIGVIAFGTLQWELAVIQQQGLDKAANLKLNLITLANPQAGKIALHSGTVDIGVADWFWVSNQRANNNSPLTFAPYSATAGALMVAKTSKITSIKQLANKRIGIAGGEIDKNWLLLQTLASTQYNLKLDESVNKTYGAPPILNQQLLQGRLDALLTYWHYAAQLEANGYKRLLDGAEMLKLLGIEQTLPTLGYIFDEHWANQHRQAIQRFLKISRQAKNLICTSDKIWSTVLPLTRSENKQTQTILRQRYCEGRIRQWGSAEKQAAANVYKRITNRHPRLFPEKSKTLAAGTFWDYSVSKLQDSKSQLSNVK